MTRNEMQAFVRRSFEELPPDLQAQAALRLHKAPVLVWDNLTTVQLWELYGHTRTLQLVHMEQP